METVNKVLCIISWTFVKTISECISQQWLGLAEITAVMAI
jgi:hypothetical protein